MSTSHLLMEIVSDFVVILKAQSDAINIFSSIPYQIKAY